MIGIQWVLHRSHHFQTIILLYITFRFAVMIDASSSTTPSTPSTGEKKQDNLSLKHTIYVISRQLMK